MADRRDAFAQPLETADREASAPEPWVLLGGTTGAGGLQVHTAELARALAAAGHPVTIACTSTDYFSQLLGGSPVRVVMIDEPQQGLSLRLYRRWSAALRPLAGPVAVLCRGQAGEGHPAVLAAMRRCFGRLVSIEHRMPDPLDWRQRIAGRLGARFVQRSFAVSEAVREALIRRTGTPPERVVTCPNWVDTEQFRPDPALREALRRRHDIAPGTLVIGYVGRLAPEKRVDLLIRAYRDLSRRTRRPTKLVLVGHGWKEREIRALVDELGLAQDALLTGWCPDASPWYRAFDVLVLPSLVEGFPLAVLEAMASGVPCIVHDSPGAREWVDSGRNGFVDDLADPAALTQRLQRFSELGEDAVAGLRAAARRTAVERHDRRRRLAELLRQLGALRAAERLRTSGLPGGERSYVLDDAS